MPQRTTEDAVDMLFKDLHSNDKTLEFYRQNSIVIRSAYIWNVLAEIDRIEDDEKAVIANILFFLFSIKRRQ